MSLKKSKDIKKFLYINYSFRSEESVGHTRDNLLIFVSHIKNCVHVFSEQTQFGVYVLRDVVEFKRICIFLIEFVMHF